MKNLFAALWQGVLLREEDGVGPGDRSPAMILSCGTAMMLSAKRYSAMRLKATGRRWRIAANVKSRWML